MQLPSPVIPWNLYEEYVLPRGTAPVNWMLCLLLAFVFSNTLWYLQILASCNSREELLPHVQHLVKSLPLVHYSVLKFLISFLIRVSKHSDKNKMDVTIISALTLVVLCLHVVFFFSSLTLHPSPSPPSPLFFFFFFSPSSNTLLSLFSPLFFLCVSP